MLYTIVWYCNAKPAKSSGVTQRTHLSIDEKTVQQTKQQQQQQQSSLLCKRVLYIEYKSFCNFCILFSFFFLFPTCLLSLHFFFVSVLLSTFLSDFLYSVWTISYMPIHRYMYVCMYFCSSFNCRCTLQQQLQQLSKKKNYQTNTHCFFERGKKICKNSKIKLKTLE